MSRSPLEEKLELLESRFTRPIGSPSEATLNSMSSPILETSQHSFGFAPLSGLSAGSPSRRRSRPEAPTLEDVQQATDRHLQKVRELSNHSTRTLPTTNKRKSPSSAAATEKPVKKSSRKTAAPIKRMDPSVKENTKNEVRAPAPAPRPPPAQHRLDQYFGVSSRAPTPSNTGGPSSPDTNGRIADLERALADKEEQLRAVADNRSILHASLQATLQQKEREWQQAQQEQAAKDQEQRDALESLIRTQAIQQAAQLRTELAQKGTRLGRIVHTRAGLRQVETWEDGTATKSIQERQAKLKEQQKKMQDRLEAAKRDSNSSGLAQQEAIESARNHIQTLKRLEKELSVEETALYDEKMVHIRALKRVASEDASRFQDHPKLHDRYILLSLLGKGGFSEVWKAYDLVDMREVAVKIHQLDPRWHDNKKENYTKHVSREYEIHRDVRHERIVSLLDVFEIDDNAFATVLEVCGGTDLDSMLKKRRRLPEREARSILLQILVGMEYLSKSDGNRQGIIHYDLKPGNILFDENGDAKITDFGLSKIVDSMDQVDGASMELTSQGAGTYWYLPPECFLASEHIRISNKVDVWSIGVIFYQMLFGKRPFGDGQSQDRILADGTMLNAHSVSFPDSPVVSEAGKEFIRACLTYDQAFRPTMSQICQNTYVTKAH